MYVLSMAGYVNGCLHIQTDINAKMYIWKYKPQTANKVTWDRSSLGGEGRDGGANSKVTFLPFTLHVLRCSVMSDSDRMD